MQHIMVTLESAVSWQQRYWVITTFSNAMTTCHVNLLFARDARSDSLYISFLSSEKEGGGWQIHDKAVLIVVTGTDNNLDTTFDVFLNYCPYAYLVTNRI